MAKIAILVEKIYEDLELQYARLRLAEAGHIVEVIGPKAGETYVGKYGYAQKADKSASQVQARDYALIVIPGGSSPDHMRRDGAMVGMPMPQGFTRSADDGRSARLHVFHDFVVCNMRTLLMISVFLMATSPNRSAGEERGTTPPALVFKVSQNLSNVPQYGLFEITFDHDVRYEQPFFDVTIQVDLTSPSGKTIQIGGFHYGSDAPVNIEQKTITDTAGRSRQQVTYQYQKQNLWKARFAPSEIGSWRYRYVFSNNVGAKASGEGQFECVNGDPPAHGIVRRDPNNPFQWVCDDGTPYFPFGQQEGWSDYRGDGTLLKARMIDGPFRLNRRPGQSPLPPGPMFAQGPSKEVNGGEWFKTYADAGFNLIRFSNDTGGNQRVFEDLDHYLVKEAAMLDEMFAMARKHRMRVFYTIIGDVNKAWYRNPPQDEQDIAKVKRYIDYCANRWGAMVDFWELFNEAYPDDRWNELMAKYVKSIDPYQHPVSTSYEKPELKDIDINSPHWYSEDETETESDIMTVERCMEWRRFGKPIILGEQGNNKGRQRFRDYPRPGDGGNWDPRSAVRMRLRAWTAFCHEVSFIYWNTSYAKDGYHSNIYLGPEERRYQRVLHDVAYALGGDIPPTRPLADRRVAVRDYQQVRGYHITSKDKVLVYLHHFSDHTSAIKDIEFKVTVPKAGKAHWISPETGAIVRTDDVQDGRQTLRTPEFIIDLAMLVTEGPPPRVKLPQQ